jgi:hypothetical protein
MAANDSSIFTPDTEGTQAPDDARQNKIRAAGNAFGLKNLFNSANAGTPTRSRTRRRLSCARPVRRFRRE